MLITLLFSACGGKQDAAPPKPAATAPDPAAPDGTGRRQATQEDLVKMWQQLAHQAPETFDAAKGVAIAENMAATGVEGLEPILQELADPDGAPGAKVFATITLQALTPGALGNDLIPRLIKLTEPTYNSVTRSCAAHLVGMSIHPDALEHTEKLTQDEDHSVRTAARLVLMHRGEKVGLGLAEEVWADPKTTVAERNELIRAIPQHFAADHVGIYNDALRRHDMAPDIRDGIVAILATVGNAESLESLRFAAANDPDTAVKSHAGEAIAVLEGQLNSAPAASETPEDAPAEAPAP